MCNMTMSPIHFVLQVLRGISESNVDQGLPCY